MYSSTWFISSMNPSEGSVAWAYFLESSSVDVRVDSGNPCGMLLF